MSLHQSETETLFDRMPPIGALPESGDPSVVLPYRLTTARYAQILGGMIRQGHGIEAICHFLTLTPDALLDLVVECNLPTPSSVPMRRRIKSTSWQSSDYAQLISAWCFSWKVSSIAQRISRTKSSIYSQARRLGLPKRERRTLVQVDPAQFRLPLPDYLPLPSPDEIFARNKSRSSWLVANTSAHVEVTWKRHGTEVNWTQEMNHELAMRRWSNQSNIAVARDFGISVTAITSRLYWLEIPPLPRDQMTSRYCLEKAEENIRLSKYKEVPCKDGKFTFWQHRLQRNVSRRDRHAGMFGDGIQDYGLAGLDLAHIDF